MLSCGTATSFVLSNEGVLWVTGLNHHLQLGLPNIRLANNSPPLSREYFEMLDFKDVPAFRMVCSTASTTFAIAVDENLFSWGNNKDGQLGQGDADDLGLPARVFLFYSEVTNDLCRLPKIRQVTCGHSHTLILAEDGQVLACGDNSYGQLGRRDVDISMPCNRFVEIYPLHAQETTLLKSVRSIASGGSVSAMILCDHTLWMWGSHINLQVPPLYTDDGLECRNIPTMIEDFVDDADETNNSDHERRPFLVKSISIADEHCACITVDKRVWTWGMNIHGKLGNGTKQASTCRPTSMMSAAQLVLMSPPVDICCGGFHTLIQSTVGSLWVAGACKLGIGIDGGHSAGLCRFQKVILPPCARADGGGDMRVLAISAGRTHSAIVTSCGHVMTCGKMKAAVAITPRAVQPGAGSGYCGFGGLGYFQGLAQQGHVNTFQKVYQLRSKVSFMARFSPCTLAKVQAMLVGAHFDKEILATTTKDRIFMNLLPSELLDAIIRHMLISR